VAENTESDGVMMREKAPRMEGFSALYRILEFLEFVALYERFCIHTVIVRIWVIRIGIGFNELT
jgi:hypothetical protein